MPTQRDDFKQDVTDALAKRAHFYCSNPQCRVPTLEPSAVSPGKYIYFGIASHITAAAPGGPRYDATLTSIERRSVENGIHLCGSCSMKIDKNNGMDYPTATLQRWKQEHEDWLQGIGDKDLAHLEVAYEDEFARTSGQDIVRLVRETRVTLEDLANYACIEVGETHVRLQRDVSKVLAESIKAGSLVVVGEPGAGKSGATFNALETLLEDGFDILAFSTSRLGATSMGELRTELNLSFHVHELLEHWQSSRPGLLVVDGFDAARSQNAATMLQDLMHRTARTNRWRILVSVRKFDLRHSNQLQRQFHGEPVSGYADPEFAKVRHMHVPLLSEGEIKQIEQQSPELAELINQASPDLRTLLFTPFHLRLAGELLGDGIAASSLSPIHTQIGLLERYWAVRVENNDDLADAREVVLRRAVDGMVRNAALRVDKQAVISEDSAASSALRGLLKNHVLVEWQRNETARAEPAILSFAHHILFDYAAARTLRGLPETLVKRLETETDLVLAIHPSLSLHFHYLWEQSQDREEFWEAAILLVASPTVSVVGKLIAATVAAELASHLSDIEPLIRRLEEGSSSEQEHAEATIHFLRGAVQARLDVLAGVDGSPWIEFVERGTRSLRSSVLSTLCPLLMKLCDTAALFNPEQLTVAGTVARRMLVFAWSSVPVNSWLANHAIEAVMRTFKSDTSASEQLVRQLLQRAHLTEYGYAELPILTRQIRQLFSSTPELADYVYRVAFTYKEHSHEKTPLGGRILPLASNRSQDYDMALYELSQAYPDFLQQLPEHALRALAFIIEARSSEKQQSTEDETAEAAFTINGWDAKLLLRSGYYDPYGLSMVSHTDHTQMLHTLSQRLRELGDVAHTPERLQLLKVALTINRHPLFWYQVLECAADMPKTLGLELKQVLREASMFDSLGTRDAAGKLLKAVFPLLSAQEREDTERTLLSLPDVVPASSREAATRLRLRLIGSLNANNMVLDETRQIAVEQEKVTASVQKFLSEQLPVEMDDDSENVDVYLNRLIDPIRALAEKHTYGTVTLAEVEQAQPALTVLLQALNTKAEDARETSTLDFAWGYLASACAVAAQLKELDGSTVIGSTIKEALFTSAQCSDPAYDAAREVAFNKGLSWGWPSARIDATRGLMFLAANTSFASLEVFGCIEKLAQDAVAAVRFQIASHLPHLFYTSPDLMWKLLEGFAETETNHGVLHGLIASFDSLLPANGLRIIGLVKKVHDRFAIDEEAEGTRKECTALFVRQFLYQGDEVCKEIITQFSRTPQLFHHEVGQLLHLLRRPLTLVPLSTSSGVMDKASQRAVTMMIAVIDTISQELQTVEAQLTSISVEDWPEETRLFAQRLHKLVGTAGMELYFASGVFDESNTVTLDKSNMQRFFRGLSPAMENILRFGQAHTAYHFIKMAEVYLDADVKEVFLFVERVVSASSSRDGFQYEGMAAEIAVRIVTRMLAEHRQMLRQDLICRQALVRILNVFAQVGWPSVVKLTYRLGEIYR